MKKIETLRQLAASENEKSVKDLGIRIEALRKAKIESAEKLAAMLEPIAHAMAALTEETRSTLFGIERTSREQAEKFERQIAAAATKLEKTSNMAHHAADRLSEASSRSMLQTCLIAMAAAALSALLVSAFWIWSGAAEVDQPGGRNRAIAKARDRSVEAIER
jgi:hypothetical protein